METISDKSLQLAKLCGVCTYLVDRIDDSIKQAKSATWTDRIIYPHAYTSTTWLSSARGGCAVCIRLLDSVMIQHGKVKGLTSPRTHEVIEGAEMSISCTVDNNIRISNGEMERVVTFRACSKNQIDHAEAAARVVALPRVEVKLSPLDISTGGESSLTFAKNWILECISTHQHCAPPPGKRSPTRLIKIGNRDCRLYISSPISGQDCPPYATLSHCWGKINMFKLTKDNIDIPLKEIPIKKIAKTFANALTVTQALGLQYLWIDSLCIVQDDIEDWNRESSLMADVYGNATVNIAATNAKDGTFGLFVERDRNKAERKYFQTGSGVIFEIMDDDLSERCLAGTPLSKRAWAFQERYLAQRTLYFTAEQIFGECHQHIACEAWPEGLPASPYVPHKLTKFPERHGVGTWSETIYHYLEGQLTYEKDIFVALSGVARQFQQRLKDQYVAGLWTKKLPWQLCWRPITSNLENHQKALQIAYRAPSWSWASICGPITWRLYSTGDITKDVRFRPVIEVMRVELIPLGQDPLGQLRDASLQLNCRAMMNHKAFHANIPAKSNHPSLDNSKNPSYFWTGLISYDQGESSDAVMNASYLLPLLQHQHVLVHREELYVCGLVVTPASGAKTGTFIRSGVFNISLYPFNSFEGLMEFFWTLPDVCMDESQYENILGPNANGMKRYTITLV